MSFLRKILLFSLSDYWFNYVMFVLKLKYLPNFQKPKSLNEKFNYIKIYKTSYDLRCLVSDRLKVREYVTKKSVDCNLINNLWVGKSFTQEVWDKLPNDFVIKANHGSGMVKVVNKSVDVFSDVSMVCENWLQIDYSKIGKEWFYEKLERILIVEEFITFKDDVPPDYKFFCMNGKVQLVQVDLDRFNGHVRNLYDRSFNRIDGQLLYKQGYDIEQPKMYNKAVEIAEKLSGQIDFIRVDLYLLDDQIYFGELTNVPGNGLESFHPSSLDFELGNLLVLDEK